MKIKPLLTILVVGIVFVGCTTSYSNTDNNSNSDDKDMMQSNDGDTLGASTKLNAYDAAPEAAPLAELQGKKATISTDKGDIVIEFFPEIAPQTVTNFFFLANEGFYNDLTFHRRVEGFVLQGGDPAGDGTGGPGYQVPQEISDRSHTRGMVATARLSDAVNPEKASSGSQFYIMLDDAPHLDNEYTIFGKVIEGLDVVDKLQVGDVMNSVTIK